MDGFDFDNSVGKIKATPFFDRGVSRFQGEIWQEDCRITDMTILECFIGTKEAPECTTRTQANKPMVATGSH
jgi:hypothetical protein